MDFGHHGGNPAHVEVFTPWSLHALQAFADIVLHRRLPEALIGHIDGELPGISRNGHTGVGENELAGPLIQGETIDTLPCRENQHGGWTIKGIACAHLLGTSLEEVLQSGLGDSAGIVQDGEDRPYRDIHIGIGGAIQRIEQQQVLTSWIHVRNSVDPLHFLRGHSSQKATPLNRINQHFIGENIQFLLNLALHIFAVSRAQYTDQVALIGTVANPLAGYGDETEQRAERSIHCRPATLRLTEKLIKTNTFLHDGFTLI
ncbi:conserved hypothetical protein [Pseudomonas sp. P14-2025]